LNKMGVFTEKRDFHRVRNKYGEMDIFYEPPGVLNAFANCTWEPHNVELIQKGNYDLYVDVGAAWGYFTQIASKHCTKVIAIDAHPLRFGYLLWNCRTLYNVEFNYVYITSDSKKAEIAKIPKDPIRMVTGSGDNYIIKRKTLDELLLLDISYLKYDRVLIKMDIEGGELAALEGASELLKDYTNVHWTIDYHEFAGVKLEDVISRLCGRKYEKIPNANKIVIQ